MDNTFKAVDAKFRMPDALWERLEGLLPRFRRSSKGGRPRVNLRNVLDGIFYVLRTGCQWKALPRDLCSSSTAHRYFQLFVKRGIFADLWHAALEEYDDLKGLDWEWQSMDGAMTKAPLGGEKNWAQPNRSRQVRNEAKLTHRGARDTNRSSCRGCQFSR